MARVIPYLALLACPLMMLFCMRGMRGMGQQQAESKPEQPTTDQRIAQLEQELAELRAAQQQPAPPPASWVEPSANERGTGRAVRPS